jgi:hypothetical protein
VSARFGVTVLGDLLRFSDVHGDDVARIAAAGLSGEDRQELARRFNEVLAKAA